MGGRLSVVLLLLLLGEAQAQASAEAMQRLFENFLGGAEGFRERLTQIVYVSLGSLVQYTNGLALALFVLGFVYRIYDLWLSEAQAQELLTNILRLLMIGFVLLLSNYHITGQAPPEHALRGPTGCGRNDIVLSRIALCTWERAMEAGMNTFLNQRNRDRLNQAINRFAESLILASTLSNVGKVLKAYKQTLWPLRKKTGGGNVQEAGTSPGGGTGAGAETKESRLERTLREVIAPLVMLFLIFPLIVLTGIYLLSATLTTAATILLPVAIALLAFGLSQPVLRVGGTILGQAITIWLLPLFFFIASIFSLEQPSQTMQAMMTTTIEQAAAALNELVGESEEMDQEAREETNKAGQQGLAPWEWLKRIEERVGEVMDQFLEKVSAILASILFALSFFLLMTLLFFGVVYVSYTAGMRLLTMLPAMVGGMFGGEGREYAVPLRGRGTYLR